jgi:hypothetical protein
MAGCQKRNLASGQPPIVCTCQISSFCGHRPVLWPKKSIAIDLLLIILATFGKLRNSASIFIIDSFSGVYGLISVGLGFHTFATFGFIIEVERLDMHVIAHLPVHLGNFAEPGFIICCLPYPTLFFQIFFSQ